MQVRPMTLDDCKEVARIHTESWRYAYKGIVPDEFLDSIDVKKREENWSKGMVAEPEMVRIVAVDPGGRIVGFACGLECRDKDLSVDGELYAIYVSPQRIGAGAGALLFEAYKNKLVRRGMSSMIAWVLEENRLSRDFYERMGGEPGEKRKNIAIGGKSLVEVFYRFDLTSR